MRVLDEIAVERKLQIARGYDAAHDDEHTGGEIARAAASFAANDPRLWPWGALPIHEGGRRETLIKAAALLVAEIERFDRIDANVIDGCSTITGAYIGAAER